MIGRMPAHEQVVVASVEAAGFMQGERQLCAPHRYLARRTPPERGAMALDQVHLVLGVLRRLRGTSARAFQFDGAVRAGEHHHIRLDHQLVRSILQQDADVRYTARAAPRATWLTATAASATRTRAGSVTSIDATTLTATYAEPGSGVTRSWR